MVSAFPQAVNAGVDDPRPAPAAGVARPLTVVNVSVYRGTTITVEGGMMSGNTEESEASTRAPGRDWRTEFDLSDPTFGDRFDEICDDLVAHCPAAKTVDGEWVISRHADVLQILQDHKTFASGTGIRGIKYQPPEEELLRPNEMDPPTHAWLRSSWNPYFTPQSIAGHETEIRRIIDGLVDAFIADGEVELVSRYSDPLACASFCQAVAHMPPEDMPFLQRTFQGALAGGTMEERGENWVKAHAYTMEFLEGRRQQPRRDDIVDTILHFEYPDGRAYTDAERASSLMQVTAAGLVTTGAIVSGAIYHLATNPQDRERLRADPSLMGPAIEEFLRAFAAAPMIGRRVTTDVEIAGLELSAGDYVWYNVGGANRDPSVIDDPAELRIDRDPNKHLSFAAGVHRCLGPHFARMNIRIALDTFLSRIPEFSLRPGFEPHFEGGMTRRMTSLELVFDTAA
jgi:cytochrome P450